MHLSFGDSVTSWRETRYSCVKRLGSGGASTVYAMLATSGVVKGNLFAVKFFDAQGKGEGWHWNFMKEVHFLRGCDHPNVAKVFDEGVHDSTFPFVVMELMGGSLHEAYRRKIQFDDCRKISIVVQLLSALNYLSRLDPPGVHCDIKPQNILFKGMSCVLSDFGLVKLLHADTAPDAWTVPKHLPMAQGYRTPELIPYMLDGTPLPPPSDVFQLGLVAAELFTGQNPLDQKGGAKRVELNPLAPVPGRHSDSVSARLNEMLVRDTHNRIIARDALRLWQELLLSAYAPNPRKPRQPKRSGD